MSTPAVQVPATLSVDETIRATVRALRSARQVDVPPLARHIGVSRGSFYNRLNGAAPFLAAEIAGLAQFFGVPITDFYDGIVRVGAAPTSGATDAPTRRYATSSAVTGPMLRLVKTATGNYPDVAGSYGPSAEAPGYACGTAVTPSAGMVNDAHAA